MNSNNSHQRRGKLPTELPLMSFSGITNRSRIDMKQELMIEVMQQMLPHLDNAQLKQLRQVMEHGVDK